ncbi:asparaginase [Streptococcus zalophi]|uniref:asparaginase n=1 Tax=Streptococcus zalophi TaxID=640031 RepID=A0A934UDV2_9STRE|nr:asparaginase [Streptococcus zalophi]MBJ8350159.1 asparaginase [Streptococcus zalophi]MCR8968199.1 asparaginase [Streptococcus zalophi]
MKKILVLHTGGTIAMHSDRSGHIVTNDNNPMASVEVNLDNIELSVKNVLNVPSPHITVDHMLLLFRHIKEADKKFDGVVITHGTDTLEETAYFLDTMAIPNIPIVLTGAMRSSNALGSDGIYNYLCALRVAAHPKAYDKGVLVVMNEEIHAAKYVTKTHTTNVSTFQTPTHGPLGIMMKDDILFFKTADPRVRFDLHHISGVVPIIKAYAGMEDDLINLLQPDGIDGVVVEAFGAGNMPPKAAIALENLIKGGTPVVLVSRCFNGIAEAIYDYEGGGIQLSQAGVMFVKELNAQKARLKLLIALNAGLTGEALKEYIEG